MPSRRRSPCGFAVETKSFASAPKHGPLPRIDFEQGTITAYRTKGRVRLGRKGHGGNELVTGRPVFFQAEPSLMHVVRAVRQA
ncbi:Hypothetical protein A7982_10960 [Minicystis rosea]|nr:Hypothetical protein A7982_10960 [Minicystis rosea]